MRTVGNTENWQPAYLHRQGVAAARALLVAQRFGWSKDDDLAMAFDVVSSAGARALGIQAYGLEAGCTANLVLLPAENLAAAVVDRSARRTVISRGKIVARDGVFLGL